MKIKPAVSVLTPDRTEQGISLALRTALKPSATELLEIPKSVAYVPLINSHDHLIGNWFPRAGENRPYPNSHIWVEDMKKSFAFQERNKFWYNDGSFILTEPNALLLAQLGSYKSLFSGCGFVHDHCPVQFPEYYEKFPLTVIREYRQCHSLTMGNWWGGESCEIELQKTEGKVPFIIHLGEGTDEITGREFSLLKEQGLLQSNTLMIHGIAFTRVELAEVARIGASICWCPSSNYYLIGETLDILSCLELGVNVVIGTDSTMSGGINLLAELHTAHSKFPRIPVRELYRFVTVNAAKALFIPSHSAVLNPNGTKDLLLTDKLDTNVWENLLTIETDNIRLLLHKGKALYGDIDWLEHLELELSEYSFIRAGRREKFVLGDPWAINDKIDQVLGYHKDFPYLPF